MISNLLFGIMNFQMVTHILFWQHVGYPVPTAAHRTLAQPVAVTVIISRSKIQVVEASFFWRVEQVRYQVL